MFQQLTNNKTNIILRKKLCSHGKAWIIISSISLASGISILNNTYTIKADTVNTEVSSKTDIPSDQDVTVDVYILSNKGKIKTNLQVTGKIGETKTIDTPKLDGYKLDSNEAPPSTIDISIEDDSSAVSQILPLLTDEEYETKYDSEKYNHSIYIISNIDNQSYDITGKPGEDVTIDTPLISGYMPNVDKLTFHINTDNSVSQETELTYSRYDQRPTTNLSYEWGYNWTKLYF